MMFDSGHRETTLSLLLSVSTAILNLNMFLEINSHLYKSDNTLLSVSSPSVFDCMVPFLLLVMMVIEVLHSNKFRNAIFSS